MNLWTLNQDNLASMRIRPCRSVCAAKYSIPAQDVVHMCIFLSSFFQATACRKGAKRASYILLASYIRSNVFFLRVSFDTSAIVALLRFVLQFFAICMHGNNRIQIVESSACAYPNHGG